MMKTGSQFAHIFGKRFGKIYLFCLLMNLSCRQINRWDMTCHGVKLTMMCTARFWIDSRLRLPRIYVAAWEGA